MYEIEEDDVKDMLRFREQRLTTIRKKTESLCRELEGARAALSTSGKEMPEKDAVREHRKVIRQALKQLAEEEEAIRRVWCCLCRVEEPYFGILRALYVENRRYQETEEASGLSHKSFETYRKRGILQLLDAYGELQPAFKLDECSVKKFLRRKDQWLSGIGWKKAILFRELEEAEVLLEDAVLADGAFPERIRKLRHWSLEIRQALKQLAEEEEAVLRVHACLQKLEEPYRSLLGALYAENQLCRALEYAFDGSHKTFDKYRRQGIARLISLYETGTASYTLPPEERRGFRQNIYGKR